jgi:hypothetical protein
LPAGALDGTTIVRRLLLPVVVRWRVEGLSVAKGPLGLTVAESVKFPWNPLRLCRLSVIVELLPARIITLLVELLRLKSVAVIVS